MVPTPGLMAMSSDPPAIISTLTVRAARLPFRLRVAAEEPAAHRSHDKTRGKDAEHSEQLILLLAASATKALRDEGRPSRGPSPNLRTPVT